MKTVSFDKISNYVILFCQNMGVTISPLKLQKILYYIQAWHIAKFDKAILFNDLPEAWVNGPVYREVYNSYKATFFRNENITTDLDEESLSNELQKSLSLLNLDANQNELINAVLEAYTKLSDERLVFMTHSEAPWLEARKGLSPIERSDKKLSIDDMYNYFNKAK